MFRSSGAISIPVNRMATQQELFQHPTGEVEGLIPSRIGIEESTPALVPDTTGAEEPLTVQGPEVESVTKCDREAVDVDAKTVEIV